MDKVGEAAEKLRLVVRVLNRRAQIDTGAGSPTRSEQAVLAWLDEHGAMTPTALAQSERVRPKSMGQTLDALEQAGLVRRRRHPDDRRQVLMSLTHAGRRALGRGRRLRQAWLARAMRTQLNADERHTLFAAIELLERIVHS